MKTLFPSFLVASLLVFSSCSSVKSSFEYSSQERYKRSKNIKLIALGEIITLGQEEDRFSREGLEIIGTSLMDRNSAMEQYRLEREIRNCGLSVGATRAAYSYAAYFTKNRRDAAAPNLHQYSIYFLRKKDEATEDISEQTAEPVFELNTHTTMNPLHSKVFLSCFSILVSIIPFSGTAAPPNIVVLFADDMGYGDLASYGHPRIRTPHLDQLARDGIRLTSFVTGSWCVPSRTQLITGRYLPRVKFNGSTGSDGKGGLPGSEWTLAEALKNAGYQTHMVGKWHLGYKEKRFLPVNQGFDTWFGLPYSNDYMKPWVQTDEPLGLYRGDKMVEHPFDQDTLTTRYTNEATKLIEAADDKPFFLYFAYAMPHLPIHVSDKRRGKSQAGLYGDVIEEVDWSVGQALAALKKKGVAKNTLVFFASDNGPWIEMPPRMRQAGNELWHAGSAGPLRGSKGQTYEGGPRVPAILRWPGKIEPGQVSAELVGMPDIYRTLVSVAGGKLPEHKIDGHDLTPFLTGKSKSAPRKEYFYFRRGLEALRSGNWKLRLTTGEPELFDMVTDPFERINRAESETEKVSELQARMKEMAAEVGVTVSGLK